MRRQRPILATVATVVACTLAMPGLVSAATQPEAVRLEVDVSALPNDRLAEDTRTWVLKHQTTAFQEAGFTVSEDASRVVRIEISRYGEYGVNTKARLTVVGDEGLIREFTCEACRDSQFLDKVGQETAALAEQLRGEIEASREPAAEPEPTIEQPPETATQDEGREPARGEEPTDHEGAPLGAAGYAGIGALAVGAGMTLGGAIVLLQGESRTLHPDRDRQLEVTDRAPLGAGLTSVGIGLLVTGAVLVTIDQTVLRKRRSSRAQASVVVPVVAPTGLGLSWAARF